MATLSADDATIASEPPKISKFFSNSSNCRNRVQQPISFSLTNANFIFIACILSVSQLCSPATAAPTQALHDGVVAGLLPPNTTDNGSVLLLDEILTITVGPPRGKSGIGKSAAPAANSVDDGGGQMARFADKSQLNVDFKFLNVSGKIGTPLSIAYNQSKKCDDKQFECGNGECVPIRFVCDGDRDCPDRSDELSDRCKFEGPCGVEQFRCGSGLCIPNKWRCDQENDCADGSDEQPLLCMHYCQPSEIKCKNGLQCIPRGWICDGSPDCVDKSDEAECKSKTCSPDEYSCKSGDGECIPLAWMCDQSKDCSDGSDEASCNETCRSDEYTCGNGRCIQKRWVCDRDDDCGDNSDEKSCPTMPCNEHTDFTCADGACITRKWRCDGDPDCPDGSDEVSCLNATQTITPCLSREFQCKDRITCLHQSWLCDGERDCPDGDDELPLNCRNVSCRGDQFQCGDRACIAGHLTCNGVSDCADGSDEVSCAIARQTTCNATTQFDCGGGNCIALSKVCDRQKDCPDGEDEPAGKCTVDECAINNGGCAHKCVDEVIGFKCECEKGYKLSGKSCVDIDECQEPGACSQLCVNEDGTFKCECEAGYMRDPRNHTRCKATEGHASLLLARRHDIRKIALDHMEMTSIVNNTKSATALDFVFRTGMIFWSDVSTQSIYKAPIDEGNDKTIVLKDHSVTSDGLAVDWIYNHIYFTDTHKCTIELTNFDGNMGKVLIEDELDIPRSIALDPIEGWMYWSDWGASPRIERAGMDGTHRTTIISYDVKWPNGITLDLVRKRIYWVDGKLNVISSANYDGSQRRQILYSTEYLRHPFSITTFEDHIYWTDWDKQTVFKANKFNGEDVEAITAMHMLQHPMVIHVYHPYRQPDAINHCQAVNGHCSHLCLPAPRINERSPRISCACPTGLKLMDDRLMCVEDSPTAGDDSDKREHMAGTLINRGEAKETNDKAESYMGDDVLERHRYDTYAGEFLYAMCAQWQLVEVAQEANQVGRRRRELQHVAEISPAAEIDNRFNYNIDDGRWRDEIVAVIDDRGGPATPHVDAIDGRQPPTATAPSEGRPYVYEANIGDSAGNSDDFEVTIKRIETLQTSSSTHKPHIDDVTDDDEQLLILAEDFGTTSERPDVSTEGLGSVADDYDAVTGETEVDGEFVDETASKATLQVAPSEDLYRVISSEGMQVTVADNFDDGESSKIGSTGTALGDAALLYIVDVNGAYLSREQDAIGVRFTVDDPVASTLPPYATATTTKRSPDLLPFVDEIDGYRTTPDDGNAGHYDYEAPFENGPDDFDDNVGEATLSPVRKTTTFASSTSSAPLQDITTPSADAVASTVLATDSAADAARLALTAPRQFYRRYGTTPGYLRWLCRRMSSRMTSAPGQHRRRPVAENVDKRPAGNTTHADGTIIPLQQPDSGYIAIVVIAILLGSSLVIGALLYLGYRHCSRRTITSINFENPVYRKTTEDHFSLEKNLPSRMYPSTVDEESKAPLTGAGTEFV